MWIHADSDKKYIRTSKREEKGYHQPNSCQSAILHTDNRRQPQTIPSPKEADLNPLLEIILLEVWIHIHNFGNHTLPGSPFFSLLPLSLIPALQIPNLLEDALL